MYTLTTHITFESREQAELALEVAIREADSIVTNAMDDSDDAQGEALDRVAGGLSKALDRGRTFSVPLVRKPTAEDLRPETLLAPELEFELTRRQWNLFAAFPMTEFEKLGIENPQGDPMLLHGPDGQQILVDPSGYDYARYAARLA